MLVLTDLKTKLDGPSRKIMLSKALLETTKLIQKAQLDKPSKKI